MKKLLFSLFSLSILFVVSACSSDDDPKVQKFFNGDCKQVVSLESGPAGSPITNKKESNLDDMLSDINGYGWPIVSGELIVAGSNTSAKVVGLPEGVVLKNVIININGIKHEFGDISNENANLNLYTDANDKFFKDAFATLVPKKKMVTEVTFTPSERIREDVSLEIIFSGKYSYWVKQ
mgnify:CR=1 FL=1